uniref:Putative acetyltransferase (GNAT) family protein n=1 Tax=uncultured marine microorganism HF4000_APKG8C21 TaxID=455553 RepID=B3TA22_9ZZZZ|nr:putative acetyltransferase (GNAT) family protein [uncultured marine microorganism HF4000_APKG8C21]
MPQRTVSLRQVTKQDVSRIQRWLGDETVSASWFGRYSYGDPAHLGYHPSEMEGASDDKWERVFNNSEHRILSIYTDDGEHIGEIHIAVEESLGDGQISILIGRTDLWHQGYGTAGTKAALDKAFSEFGLYRVWVDIPEYNTAARSMFAHLGFVHEGTLRQSRPHEGSRFDSVVMGILATEYAQRVPDETTEVHSV